MIIMIFHTSKIKKGYERLILREFEELTGVAIRYLSKQSAHRLFMDLKDADESSYADEWFKQSGLEKKLRGMVEPNEDGIYDLIQLSFTKGVQDGLHEIDKTFVMTKGYRKSLEHLVNYNFKLIKNTNTETIESIRKTITQAVATGEGHSATVKRLSKLDLEPVGRVTPRQRANMISRTEVNRAFNTGNKNAYASWGIDKVDLITAENGVCDICLDLEDNNPHPIEELNPPIHPNCRCAVAAHVIGSIFSELDKNVSIKAEVPY